MKTLPLILLALTGLPEAKASNATAPIPELLHDFKGALQAWNAGVVPQVKGIEACGGEDASVQQRRGLVIQELTRYLGNGKAGAMVPPTSSASQEPRDGFLRYVKISSRIYTITKTQLPDGGDQAALLAALGQRIKELDGLDGQLDILKQELFARTESILQVADPFQNFRGPNVQNCTSRAYDAFNQAMRNSQAFRHDVVAVKSQADVYRKGLQRAYLALQRVQKIGGSLAPARPGGTCAEGMKLDPGLGMCATAEKEPEYERLPSENGTCPAGWIKTRRIDGNPDCLRRKN